MNSHVYKGYSNNEYGLYETLDNGRNWALVNGDVPANGVATYDRIIYGSTENKGLRYSDNGGLDIIPSDHPTGNWDGITYEGSKVFAHSMDGDGIFYSEATETNGIGEVWTKIIDAPKESVEVTRDVETGDIRFVADNVIIPISPATAEPKDPIPNVDNSLTDVYYRGALLVVLNQIVMPQLIFKLTGKSDLSTLSYFNSGITYGNTSYNNIFTASNLYKDQASDDVNFTVEDFKNLAGMMPFNIDVAANTEITQDFSNVPLTDSAIEVEETDTILKDTLDLIDRMLEVKKEYASKRMANTITSVPVDCDNLLDLDLTDEEYAKAMQTQKMLFDVQKASIISIVSTMLNTIYSFDTQRKIALLKAAIYETVIKIGPNINYQLKQIEKKLNDPEFTITANDLVIDYDFSAGLETATVKYFDTVFANIKKILTVNNSGSLKNYAASWYKEYYRDDVLRLITDKIKQHNIVISSSMLSHMNDNADKKTAFVTKVRELLPNLTGDVTGAIVLQNLDDDIKLYAYGVNAIKDLTDKSSIENALDAIEESYSQFNATDAELKEIVKDYIDNIYNNLIDMLNTELNTVITSDYYVTIDDYSNLNNDEILVVQNYCDEIALKFKERCKDLMTIIYNNFLTNISNVEDDEDGYDYYVEYIKDCKNNGMSIEKIQSVVSKNIGGLLKKSWVSMREMI